MAATGTLPQEPAVLHGHERFSATSPLSIYELHLGSWMRMPEENNRVLTDEELVPKLADYVHHMGYTHVLILDPGERDLRALVNYLHERQLGVLVNGEAIDDPRRYLEEIHIDAVYTGDMVRTAEDSIPPYKLDQRFAQDLRTYLASAPHERKLHHDRLTFRRTYGFQDNYILPLSHRELAPLMRMPGDEWQKFANFRLLLAYMYLQPGKKLLFMGHDFAQWREWTADRSIDWHLTQFRYHRGVQEMVRRLNDLYLHEPALHEGDVKAECFEWIDCHDAENGTISWLRWDAGFNDVVLAVFNFTPKVHRNFKVGAPRGGCWHEILNTDAQEYGGSGQGNFGGVQAAPFGWHGRPNSVVITVPPLAAVAFKGKPGE